MKRTYSIIAAIGFFILCTWLLTLPGSKFPKDNWLDKIGVDKIVHVVLFATLTWLWCHAFRKSGNNAWVLICLFSFLYGVVMEFIQRDYIPNRGFDVWDIVADAGGVLLGLYLFMKYPKK